tara:strand:- start:1090 stop:1593 length:504 start_codon:yes stop_codon:yes gene_type:complete
LVSIESLKDYVSDCYYYSRGKLFRRTTKTRWKKDEEVGEYVGKRGYKTISILGKRYYTHQIIFLIHRGYIPELIDHENKNKLDNNIDNLKDSSKIENALNLSGPHKDNQLGVLGVFKRKDTGKYVAQFSGERLGEFKTAEEAQQVYDKAKFSRNEELAARRTKKIIQ